MKSHGWIVLALVLLFAVGQVTPAHAADRTDDGSGAMGLVAPPGEPDGTGDDGNQGKEGDPDSWSDGQNVFHPVPSEDQPVVRVSILSSWWSALLSTLVGLLR